MEFLGDALLEFVITRHLSYKEFRLGKRGVLCHLRSAAVNNETFAQVVVRHKLYDYLLYDSSVLRENVENYVKAIQSQDRATLAQFDWRGDYGPKVSKSLL